MGRNLFARAVFLAVASILVGTHSAAAQNIYGSLVGNVTDSSGAAIPGATVTATQTETNLKREVVSNASGAYTIPNIPSGTYQVVVAVPGFQTFTANSVTVTNRDVRVDARLSLGALEEAVTVTATAAILQTENAAVQHIANSEQLQTLPTSGRAFQSFMTLMPGVADPNYQQSGGINNPGRTMSLTINGQPATNTVVRLDGITATNQFFESIQSYGPSLEAIETVNVVTSSFDADQGMAGAAAVNVQVKTGTNNFRGSAFEYAVDARMRARNYFLPADRDKGTSSVHVFGGTIGGPIVRNKLFFFFSDETTRQRTFNGNAQGQTGTSGFVSIAPADLRRGDFSQSGTPIYDPLTGNATTGAGRVPFAFANCGITSTTDPRFASCNFIPQNRINPIAASMLSKLVLPTQPGYNNNYFVVNGYDTTYHKLDAKITYNPGPRLNLNGRLGFLPSWERSLGILPSVDGSPTNPLSQGRVWDSFVDSHSIGATSILSQSFVVDGSFGYTKHNVHVFPPVDTCYGDVFGLKNSCQAPYSLDTNVPDMNVQGWTMNGQSPIRDYVDPQWQFVANAGWTKGSHNVKFGLDYIILFQDHYETQAQAFAFNGGVTTLNGAANNFNRFAAFLLGMPSSRTAQVMTPMLGDDASGASHPSTGTPNEFRPNTLRNNNVGTYIRDQWNITPKITASVGVRWEDYSLPRRADHGIEVYDFAANRLLICGVGPNDENCGIEVEKNLFTPRLGLAYRPMEDLVVRVGYSRNPQSNNPGRQQMVPAQSFPQTIVITEEAPNNVTAVGSLNDGSTRVIPADQTSGVLVLPRGAGVNTYRDEYVRGKISSWNLSVQKALGTRMSATFAYVANRQNGMTRNLNLNYGVLGGGSASLPFNPLGITSAMNVFAPEGKVKYDSMQLSMNRRMSDGMQFTVAYTYAKTIDWWRTAIPQPEYWYLNKGETGAPHRVNASLIYELPFGTGQRWLNDESVVAKIAGGWQVNTFFSYASGSLVTVTGSTNPLNAPNVGTQFADKVKDGDVEIFGDVGPNAQYFDVSAYRPVPAGELRFGNSGQGEWRGPTAPNVDMSLFRVFRIGQTKTLQIRAEVFNVSNTPHFSNPAANISNVVFAANGTITNLGGVGGINSTDRTGRQYDEREWRFGARFGF